MKKQLLTAVAFAIGLGFANAQTFEIKNYEITLEVNELTGKEDTVEVQDVYSKLNTSDSSLIESVVSDYKYYPNAKLDLKSKVILKGSKGSISVINGSLIADSVKFYSANTSGAANWVSTGYSATSYNGNVPKESITYYDLSAFGLPGLTAMSKDTYTFPNANTKTKTSFNLLENVPKDSSINYFVGKNDTASYSFYYDENLEEFIPDFKTTSKYNTKGEITETIDFYFSPISKVYEYTSKNVYTEVSATLEIHKSYSWTNNTWKLEGYDSTFYDNKGNKTLEKSYYMNEFTAKIEYTGRKIVKESFEIKPSSPVPTAPSNLTVVKANLRTTETLANSTYTLTWKDNSYNEKAFEIYRKKVGDSEFEQIGSVVANTTTYTDNSGVDGEEYVYYVLAVNGDFKSKFSNSVSSNPTGIINDESNTLKVAVYPNPTTDKWFVSGISNAKNVSLSTVDGHAIDLALQADAIDASGLNNGLYILKVEDANGITRTAKVFKK